MGSACASQKAAPHEPPPAGLPKISRAAQEVASAAYRTNCELLKVEKRAKVSEVYDVSEQIGQGAVGTVWRCTHRCTGEQQALKTVKKCALHLRSLCGEVTTMAFMNHENIVKILGVFEDGDNVHIAMELATGGDLCDRIVKVHHFVEDRAAIVMEQIFSAIVHMHRRQIAHRDIKPENFVFSHPGPVEGNTLKLIDFGFARRCQPGAALSTLVGTPPYMAPEVAWGSHGLECDMWSAGAVLYTMLRGRPPIKGSSDSKTLSMVRRGKWSFQGDVWRQVSSSAKLLVRAVLEVKTASRMTAERALSHPWVEHFVAQ